MHSSQKQVTGKDNPKYKEAVRLFCETSLTRKEICVRCHLTVGAFNAHLQKYHRDLLFRKYGVRNNVDGLVRLKIKERSGQSVLSKQKYQEAIEACRNLELVRYSISDIAHSFKLSPTGLGNQLRAHYPEILAWRYQEQLRRGIPTHQQRAWKTEIGAQYAKALDLLQNTTCTLKQAAERCQVSFSGLRQHVLFYHQDLVAQRRKIREKNKGQQRKGKKTGSNTTHEPRPATVRKYAAALEMFRTTALSKNEIVERCKISYGGFTSYLRTWHQHLVVERNARVGKGGCVGNPEHKHYLVSTAAKYAKAIHYLKHHDVSIMATARLFSFHPESFRAYLKEHEPELAAWYGMCVVGDGQRVLRRSYEKYKRAIFLLHTTTDSLNDIAMKCHLHPDGFRSFLNRHDSEFLKKRGTEKGRR